MEIDTVRLVLDVPGAPRGTSDGDASPFVAVVKRRVVLEPDIRRDGTSGDLAAQAHRLCPVLGDVAHGVVQLDVTLTCNNAHRPRGQHGWPGQTGIFTGKRF